MTRPPTVKNYTFKAIFSKIIVSKSLSQQINRYKDKVSFSENKELLKKKQKKFGDYNFLFYF